MRFNIGTDAGRTREFPAGHLDGRVNTEVGGAELSCESTVNLETMFWPPAATVVDHFKALVRT